MSDSCILVWDAQTATSTLASGDAANSVPEGSTCDWPTLTPDGRYVAFLSTAPNLVTNALMGDTHLYRRELPAAKTILVDVDTNGAGSPLTSLPIPAMSADGRLITFECDDARLVPDDDNRCFDRLAGTTMLVTASRFGAYSADNRSLSPVFGGNSERLLFASWASDLTAGDFNFNSDIFALNVRSSGTVNFSLTLSSGPSGVWISWPAVPGKRYRVQFRDQLSADSAWQDLSGSVAVVGNTGCCQAPARLVSQTFYRVVAY
jgi:hypothetical protein